MADEVREHFVFHREVGFGSVLLPLHGRVAQPFGHSPHVIGQSGRHRGGALLRSAFGAFLSERLHGPAEIVAEVTELGGRSVLRKPIGFADLSATAVAIGAVVPLDEAGMTARLTREASVELHVRGRWGKNPRVRRGVDLRARRRDGRMRTYGDSSNEK